MPGPFLVLVSPVFPPALACGIRFALGCTVESSLEPGVTVLNRLLESGSTVSELKTELDRSTQSVRRVAHRVANASSGPRGDFPAALRDAQGEEAVDLEEEMVSLAEEQIRYQATSRLLEKVYRQIRSGIRDR